LKITFYGHFGTANTGNESTLLAIVSNLREGHPDWQFASACSEPGAVAERLGIESLPISTRTVRIWNRRLRLGRRITTAALGLTYEFKEWIRIYGALRGTTMLVIPGLGMVSDAYGLSVIWGPYNLFKWTSTARLRGCKVRFLSVGAGPIYSGRGRLLLRNALALADYRSYRDEPSMECARQIGVHTERDRIYPDLAFSLPPSILPTVSARPERRRVIGLGLMGYQGRYSAADPNPGTYPAYLESLVILAQWLLEHDYDIRLLLGDGDHIAIDEFRSLLWSRVGSYDKERVVNKPISSVDDVLSQLASTDVVVATRFHNVLLALLLNKPVVAISFHHKCSSLMEAFGLSDYCHDIHEIDAYRLIDQFQNLEGGSETVRRRIARRVDEFRTALDEQYSVVFDGHSVERAAPVEDEAA
jgi:polysaccharide pyruvyl transferase WcaK-like protein